MRFLISVPAWGRCVETFLGPVLDSHADALASFGHEVRYLIHTDDAERIRQAIESKTGRRAECRPAQRQAFRTDHDTLRACHRDAIASAADGDIVVLLCADILISVETFSAIERRMSAGKRAIVCCGTRTLPAEWPKRGIASAELLSWAMRNMHPITKSCIYGTGMSSAPWAIYFKRERSTVLRGFHLHPLAIVKSADSKFEKSVDWNLAACFPPEEIHIVTDKDELAMAEISPADRAWKYLPAPFGVDEITKWTRKHTMQFHWWQFSHRIVIEGDDMDCGDSALEQALLQQDNRMLNA